MTLTPPTIGKTPALHYSERKEQSEKKVITTSYSLTRMPHFLPDGLSYRIVKKVRTEKKEDNTNNNCAYLKTWQAKLTYNPRSDKIKAIFTGNGFKSKPTTVSPENYTYAQKSFLKEFEANTNIPSTSENSSKPSLEKLLGSYAANQSAEESQ